MDREVELRHSVYAESVLGDSAALAKPRSVNDPERADGERAGRAGMVTVRRGWPSGVVVGSSVARPLLTRAA